MLLFTYLYCACVLLFPWFTSAEDSSLRLDGGEIWDEESWSVLIDGVMGGKSTGYLDFDDNGKTLVFTGEIDLDGGGFSSVRRSLSPPVDLSAYAGIVVEIESANSDATNNAPPLGLQLQLSDVPSRFNFAAAFVVPLTSAIGIANTTISRVFLPMSDFTRGGYGPIRCVFCSLDPSSINEIDVYLLFQEGPFEVRLKSITAVKEPQAFGSPVVPFLDGSDSSTIIRMLQDTIYAGNKIFDKSYVEVCTAMYWSTVNTIVASSVDDDSLALKYVACSGLAEAMRRERSKEDIKTILEITLNAMISDIRGDDRYAGGILGIFLGFFRTWLPDQGALPATGDYCSGITSTVPTAFYNSESFSVVMTGTGTNRS